MKITYVRGRDDSSFKYMQKLGFQVVEISDLEHTDDILKGLVEQKYNPIIVSQKVASFSEDICVKYKKDEDINIIIQ